MKSLVPNCGSSRSWLRAALLIAVAVSLFGAIVSAHAQSAPAFNVLDGVQAKFEPLKTTWGSIIKVYAERLFWALVAVDFAWTTIAYVIDKNDIGDMLGSLVKKVMTITFFFSLLKMSDTWIPMILDSFSQIGKEAGGAGGTLTSPDGIASVGFSTALGMYEALSGKGMADKIAMALPITALALLVFLSFLFVAAQLLVTLIESYIAIGGGIIMLGFGGSRWTTDMASKYMQYAVATGVKLLVIYLIVGAGQALFDGKALIDANNVFMSCMQAAGAGLVYAYLAVQVPAIASAMMSGSPTMTAGGMMGAAVGAGAAIAGAGAAAMAGGAGLVAGASGAAAGATGLAKALSAGLNSGLDLGKSGGALAAHALGEVGKHGLGLAKGAVGDAVSSGKTGFAQKVDGSAGGRIASSIESTRGGSVAGVPAPPMPGGQGAAASSAAPASGGAQQGPAGSPAPSGGASSAMGSSTMPTEGQGSAASSVSTATGLTGDATPAGTAQGSPGVPAPAPGPGQGAGAAPSAGQGQPGTGRPNPSTMGQGGASTPAASSPSGSGAPAAPSGAPKVPSGAGASGPASTSPPAASAPLSTTGAASTHANTGTGSPGTQGGDGSTGALTGDIPGSKGDPSDRDPLHRRIQELQGYVPQDAAHAASINIELKHSAD
ncbi:P-type conjugative transfer protein TrbL [Cupriavidus gilardii]|nr:P-type conjugative transfer protein TrbL [Cupriavidus gilardii]